MAGSRKFNLRRANEVEIEGRLEVGGGNSYSFSQLQIHGLSWRPGKSEVHLRDMAWLGGCKLKKELRMQINCSILSMSETPGSRRKGREVEGMQGKGEGQAPVQ